jgi:hypothetical protein
MALVRQKSTTTQDKGQSSTTVQNSTVTQNGTRTQVSGGRSDSQTQSEPLSMQIQFVIELTSTNPMPLDGESLADC